MTSISANGNTETIYIQDSGGGTIQYRKNEGALTTISSWPCTFNNTGTSILKILFSTNITLNVGTTQYFISGSDNIQFGSSSLNQFGNRVSIMIADITDYGGVFQNGTITTAAKNNVTIYNISVDALNGTTLAEFGGWIGQLEYGKGGNNNYIVNCFSSGDIPASCGGIVGQGSGGPDNSPLIIRGCSSTGAIGQYSGGITGPVSGSDCSIECEECWSEGNISSDAGGIFGSYAGNNSGYAIAKKCYSTGTITNDGGGIFGGYAAEGSGQAHAQNCYSRGAIQGNAGGIFSRYAGESSGTTTAVNCYSSGSLATAGYGIYGVNQRAGATSTNCYVAEDDWDDVTANTNLTGDPITSDVGDTWVKIGTNQPYELNGFGYTPYSNDIINASTSQLIKSFSQTVEQGRSTLSARNKDASGNSFSILQITGGDSSSYSKIIINQQTGVINTLTETVPTTYTISIGSFGSYFVTLFLLTIVSQDTSTQGTCCVTTINERGLDYEQINEYKIGNRILSEVAQNPVTRFDGYSEYVKYKMAQGSRKY